MRIGLTLLAVQMLKWPYLKLVGAVLSLYIGITLLSDSGDDDATHQHAGGLFAAIRTILVADLVMSLDNVLAVAAAANGSTLLLKVMERFPIIITLGAGLLGFLAGEMLMTDPAVVTRFGESPEHLVYGAGAGGAAIVLAIGLCLQRRGRTQNVPA